MEFSIKIIRQPLGRNGSLGLPGCYSYSALPPNKWGQNDLEMALSVDQFGAETLLSTCMPMPAVWAETSLDR